jgi:hypothetical protein
MEPPSNFVVKFRRIWEPPYKVLVGILEHGSSLEWRAFLNEQAVLGIVRV